MAHCHHRTLGHRAGGANRSQAMSGYEAQASLGLAGLRFVGPAERSAAGRCERLSAAGPMLKRARPMVAKAMIEKTIVEKTMVEKNDPT